VTGRRDRSLTEDLVPDETRLLADRFELGDLLGAGGMADVHRARDRVLHREVAVKVLREGTTDASDRERFTREARTLAGLSHQGLVMLLDVGTAGDRPFLVMELVEGPTLASLVGAGPADPDVVAQAGAQVAEALAYAHGAGVVHRDVKPANVLLGPGGRAKLADFGIARLVGDTVRHTRTGTTIGTAAYLSPEQVQGHQVAGATDVYSLGLTLLEASTGHRAFAGTPTESALARLHRDPEVPDHLPHAALLRAMTSRDPQDRPTAREVATALRTPVGSLGTAVMATAPAPPPSAPGPLAVGRQRVAEGAGRLRRWLLALPPDVRGASAAIAAIVLLLVVAALAASGGGGTEDDGPPTDTPAELRGPLQDLHDAVEGR
jgi:eukaryotic-like serine/threonine-protein kinase